MWSELISTRPGKDLISVRVDRELNSQIAAKKSVFLRIMATL